MDRHEPPVSFPSEAPSGSAPSQQERKPQQPSAPRVWSGHTGSGLAAQQGTAISKRGGSVSFSLPALCLAPGASVGFVGCLRIRDLVVNHFPHLRPFHSCPWDQRSSALEPCMGTAPARETAAELPVRDGGRTFSASRTLSLPLPPGRVSRDPQLHHKSSQQSTNGDVKSLCF